MQMLKHLLKSMKVGFLHIGVQKSCELTEEVHGSALSGFTVFAVRHRGINPEYAVRAGHHVLPNMLMSGGIVVNYSTTTED